LHPTVVNPRKVGEAERFVAGLAGTQPLVHAPNLFERSSDAPRGVVYNLASPVPADFGPAATEAGPVPPPAADEGTPATAPPVAVEPRRLHAAPATTPPVESLTRVADDALGPDLIHPAPPPAPPPFVPPPLHPAVPIETTFEEAPAAPTPAAPAPTPASEVPDVLAGPHPAADMPETPRRLNVGQARRLGLGMPFSRPADEPFVPPGLAPEPPPLVHPPTPPSPPARELPPVQAAPPEPEPESPPAEPTMVHRVGLMPPLPAVDVPSFVVPPKGPPEPPPTPAAGPAEPILPIYRPAPGAVPRPLPPEPTSLVLEPPPPRRVVERVPDDMAGAFLTTHGVGVHDVPIHRGPAVSAEARSLGAVAFTRRQEVFLPDEAGALHEPDTRGLIAHELTHVVQQRVFGGAPPASSPEADLLEEHAQDAERFFRGDAGAEAPRPATVPLTHVPKSTVTIDPNAYAEQISDELVNRGIARRDWDGTLVFGPSPDVIEAQISEAVQRAASRAPSGGRSPSSSSSSSDAGPTNWGEFGSLLAGTAQEMVMAEWNLDEATTTAANQQEARGSLEQERQARYDQLVAEENQNRAAAEQPPLHHENDSARLQELREIANSEFESQFAKLDEDVKSAAQRPGGGTGGAGGGTGGGQGGQQQQERSIGQGFRELGGDLLMDATELFGLSYFHDFTSDEESEIRGAFGSGGSTTAAAGEGTAGVARAGTGPTSHQSGDDNQAQSGKNEINPDDIDLDALARRLWERMRTHLRGELLVDRERSGKLTDFR
jgi:hypothetical protein